MTRWCLEYTWASNGLVPCLLIHQWERMVLGGLVLGLTILLLMTVAIKGLGTHRTSGAAGREYLRHERWGTSNQSLATLPSKQVETICRNHESLKMSIGVYSASACTAGCIKGIDPTIALGGL